MVNAILAGRKTQTRRIVNGSTDMLECGIFPLEPELTKCKYGREGDRLWVKETAIIAPKRFADDPDGSCIQDADGDPRYIQYTATHPNTEAAGWYKLKKTPSIFMPRWASRITLEIVAVRVERLQDISEADAIAEGIFYAEDMNGFVADNDGRCFHGASARRAYENLWCMINGPESWGQNPYVWAIEFRRIKP